MINRARQQLRSWMIIYAGLVAAIALAGDPSSERVAETDVLPQPVIPGAAPVARRDI